MINKLVILWVNDNPDTAKQMILMYARNAIINKWFDAVEIIIWGASAIMVANNQEVQESLVKTIESGVIIKACSSCANNLNVSDKLKELNVLVYPMGTELTTIINGNSKLLTI